jgi:hypothetical protein
VDVHVEQGWDQRGFRQLDMAARGQYSTRLGGDVGDDAFLDDHDGPLYNLIGRKKTTGGEYRSHEF